VHDPPKRLERLPRQYFTDLFARVAEAARAGGAPLVDLARGNPEVGPPPHVLDRLAEASRQEGSHGYAVFRGLPALKEAIAERYRRVYGVELDPGREVAVIPGTKTAIVELALVLVERGRTLLLPDPGYPDYPSGAALAAARHVPLPLDPAAGWAPDFDAAPAQDVAAAYLNYPSNPCAAAAPRGAFEAAVAFAGRTGAAIVHDFAYGDLVFDGRSPRSFLATPGARDVGVEMFSMSKTYGMAGWRVGFVLGNPEIVARLELLQDHVRAGIFAPVQEASIAALTGPQDTVETRRAAYERRRDRVVAALAGTRVEPEPSGGSFYVWLELPDDVTVERALAEERVALAPGEGFGARGKGWARLSLTVPDETLDIGLERLQRAFG
jgi:L-glutamine---4-(methylsulfanyl)-2-oxobutanoate aminotransferase